ncbi:ocs element-binding factor 1 [Musa troglodytarum]|uniref:Ocs element-binding factor 1 n=1 Tax=Musa troglodytarum TaxID=320322 RepID=A0A9E7EAJ1_9LILI|nr:ocs element-binding factor 1 [Musa troglodytarum]
MALKLLKDDGVVILSDMTVEPLQRLQSLNDILPCLKAKYCISSGPTDNFINPWNLMRMNQPIMALAENINTKIAANRELTRSIQLRKLYCKLNIDPVAGLVDPSEEGESDGLLHDECANKQPKANHKSNHNTGVLQ